MHLSLALTEAIVSSARRQSMRNYLFIHEHYESKADCAAIAVSLTTGQEAAHRYRSLEHRVHSNH